MKRTRNSSLDLVIQQHVLIRIRQLGGRNDDISIESVRDSLGGSLTNTRLTAILKALEKDGLVQFCIHPLYKFPAVRLTDRGRTAV